MCSQPLMFILKYVIKQHSRKLKDHNLEFPDVDLPTSDDSSRACTTMPQLGTSIWNICLMYTCTSMHACMLTMYI